MIKNNTVKNRTRAVMAAINLKKGNGLGESIFSLLILVLAFLTMFYETNPVPQWLVGLVSGVAGFWLGAKSIEHLPKQEL